MRQERLLRQCGRPSTRRPRIQGACRAETVGAGGLIVAELPYTIRPTDILNIVVWRNPYVSSTVSVRPDGFTSASWISRSIRAPLVTVVSQRFFRACNAHRVQIVGGAAKPQAVAYRQNMTMLDGMIDFGGMTDFAGHGQSPSAFAALLQAVATAGDEVVGSVEGARPNAARASIGCEGGAVGSCTSLAVDSTGKWPSGCSGRAGLSAESMLASGGWTAPAASALSAGATTPAALAVSSRAVFRGLDRS